MEGLLMPMLPGVVIGAVIGYIVLKSVEKSKGKKILEETKKKVETIIKEAKIDAESIKKDKILQAKEKFIELKSEHHYM